MAGAFSKYRVSKLNHPTKSNTDRMEIQRIPFAQIPQLADRDVAYANQDPSLRPFYKYPPTLDAFAQIIEDKQQDPIDRPLLVKSLKAQYQALETTEAVRQNIEALAENRTFTVTTAHQPALFTGPLYYIYKIISTINLAENLGRRYPEYRFVPVFISGAEDHDFEEVNHTYLFGKRLEWRQERGGPVGFLPTTSLQQVMLDLKEILGDSDDAREAFQLIEASYAGHEQYGAATIDLVNRLFRDYGLVILDMSRPELKRRFIPYARRELVEQPSKQLVEATTAQLEAAGFSQQAHAREINLFYLQNQRRDRIVFEDGCYRIHDTKQSFSETELLAELEQHPERFSPNVVMRPIYQELILPNLAYIGGGGELAYWLERKEQFVHFGVNFPALVRRNSVLWIDRGASKRLDKVGLTVAGIFADVEELVKDYVRKNTRNELSLAEEKTQLERIFATAAKKAEEIDPTLKKAVLAEGAKQSKTLEQLEGRLMRAEKQRHDTAINQIRSLKDKLFPDGALQERRENFLNFYLRYGRDFFEVLKEQLDPLEPGFVVVIDRK